MTGWQVGDVAQHKPTGLVGKVKWLPQMADLPFMYIEARDENLKLLLRQGLVKEFVRVDESKTT